MGERDTLIAEVGAAIGILGLLLVFLPLFLDAVVKAQGGVLPAKALRARVIRSWLVPLTIGVAAADSTTGLLTLWGTCELAKPTGIMLLVAVWLVVILAVNAVATVG